LTRTMFPTIPPRVDYELTELGKTLLIPVMALVNWANDNRLQIAEGQRRFDAQSDPEYSESPGYVHRFGVRTELRPGSRTEQLADR
ncbi:helix-turn-helix transcriptional regulator, partial [Solirubrobacter sp. CPCC 204708]|nr:helix-turn-helix transcriptional regulator [Solirubrobacter deserti]